MNQFKVHYAQECTMLQLQKSVWKVTTRPLYMEVSFNDPRATTPAFFKSFTPVYKQAHNDIPSNGLNDLFQFWQLPDLYIIVINFLPPPHK